MIKWLLISLMVKLWPTNSIKDISRLLIILWMKQSKEAITKSQQKAKTPCLSTKLFTIQNFSIILKSARQLWLDPDQPSEERLLWPKPAVTVFLKIWLRQLKTGKVNIKQFRINLRKREEPFLLGPSGQLTDKPTAQQGASITQKIKKTMENTVPNHTTPILRLNHRLTSILEAQGSRIIHQAIWVLFHQFIKTKKLLTNRNAIQRDLLILRII